MSKAGDATGEEAKIPTDSEVWQTNYCCWNSSYADAFEVVASCRTNCFSAGKNFLLRYTCPLSRHSYELRAADLKQAEDEVLAAENNEEWADACDSPPTDNTADEVGLKLLKPERRKNGLEY